MNWLQNFVSTWLNIVVGIGIIGITVLAFYWLTSKYVMWIDRKEEREELEKI